MTGSGSTDLARAVADAVGAVPGVARLVGDARHGGVATRGPAGRIAGVRITDRAVTVHVAVQTLPLPAVVEAVVRAVRKVLDEAGDDRAVTVSVDGLENLSALPDRRPAAGSGR